MQCQCLSTIRKLSVFPLGPIQFMYEFSLHCHFFSSFLSFFLFFLLPFKSNRYTSDEYHRAIFTSDRNKLNVTNLMDFTFFSHRSTLYLQCELILAVVSWCFEPSQPQRITSGLKTNFSLSPRYSLNKL